MARRYVSFLERISKAKTEKKRKQLLEEAKAFYGESYVEELIRLAMAVKEKP